ncbi:hypothetical protein AJ78_00525 [Emergomyces pasteurianus Ep9510]|uniref:Uncharacterized protein n=1 Tax=Emergomyces pasteurianus Ep9510 TaxID=1447872 RepID=A0A1J9PT14_9EURO|nr:hypothetical protein AJ78_00525 [Emergomyces pasteurianus Ep9510]
MPSHNIRAASSQQASADPSVLHRSFSAEAGPALSHNKPSTHKPHRPHVVVSHRPHMHVRNPSLKNINRLQRLAAAHNLPGEGDTQVAPALRHHQRKKSAPASPSTSPRPGHYHVRWNGSTVSLSGQGSNPAIRKNFSTPALRNTSGILVKKPSAMTRTGAIDKAAQKKKVGFELAASEDDDEWEDNNSSYSPESTRRNSVANVKMSADNNHHAPLTATKPPLVQAFNEPEGAAGRKTATDLTNGSGTEASQEHHIRPLDQDDIASRLLHQPHSSKVPPTISSVSATATPPAVERSPLPPSFPTLPSGRVRDFDQSGAWSTAGSTSTSNPHGTSSSIEGGVSKFLINNASSQFGAIPDSDPASSFLPHYHPNTPPSPETTISKRPTSRGRQQEPPSRTQQKLWLQRTAVLTTSPPDPSMSGPSPTAPSSSIDPAFMATTQSRPGSRDGRRTLIGAGGAASINLESEAKRARKTYDKFTTEYSVVRRFRGPVAESFLRLERMTGPDTKSNNPPLGPISGQNSAGANGTLSRPSSSRNLESDPAINHQFLSKLPKSSSQVRLRTSEDIVHVNDSDEPAERLDVEHHQQQRPNSVAVVLADGNVYDEQIDEEDGGGGDGPVLYQPNEAELLIRRMWDSREVAVAAD